MSQAEWIPCVCTAVSDLTGCPGSVHQVWFERTGEDRYTWRGGSSNTYSATCTEEEFVRTLRSMAGEPVKELSKRSHMAVTCTCSEHPPTSQHSINCDLITGGLSASICPTTATVTTTPVPNSLCGLVGHLWTSVHQGCVRCGLTQNQDAHVWKPAEGFSVEPDPGGTSTYIPPITRWIRWFPRTTTPFENT